MFPIRDNIGWTKPPMVVWTLILLNTAVFAYQLGLSDRETQVFLMKHALVPLRYFSPRWASEVGLSPLDLTPFVTNTFLHGGFLHIILNMWTLYIFGPALEDRLGTARFIVLYLGAGVAASVTHALFNAGSPVPALGASGAIAGLISAYAFRFPYAWVRVLVLIIIIPLFFDIPAMLFAGIWFLGQIMQGTSSLFMPSLGGRDRLVGAHRGVRCGLAAAAAARPQPAAGPALWAMGSGRAGARPVAAAALVRLGNVGGAGV